MVIVKCCNETRKACEVLKIFCPSILNTEINEGLDYSLGTFTPGIRRILTNNSDTHVD